MLELHSLISKYLLLALEKYQRRLFHRQPILGHCLGWLISNVDILGPTQYFHFFFGDLHTDLQNLCQEWTAMCSNSFVLFQVDLQKLAPNYVLYAPSKALRWKFYAGGGTPIPSLNWSYPFIDISFYKESSYYIFDNDRGYTKYKYPKHQVFPLVKRRFETFTLFAPKDTGKVIAKTYGNVNTCVSTNYNHQLEQRVKQQKSIPCKELYVFHPFVFRTKTPGQEILKIGNKTLGITSG